MESIDLINFRKKQHDEERRQDYHMLTRAVEEQNKKIDKLEKDKEELCKQIKEQDKISYYLEKQNQKLLKDLDYERNQ